MLVLNPLPGDRVTQWHLTNTRVNLRVYVLQCECNINYCSLHPSLCMLHFAVNESSNLLMQALARSGFRITLCCLQLKKSCALHH